MKIYYGLRFFYFCFQHFLKTNSNKTLSFFFKKNEINSSLHFQSPLKETTLKKKNQIIEKINQYILFYHFKL